MKVARLYSFDDIRVEDIPVPEMGNRDALVKTRSCGICSGDVMPWYIEKKAPAVLGHEPAGEVVDVGKDVTSFRRGERVFTHHHAPCFTCRFCRRGDYVHCSAWKNSRIVPGGVSEYILIPSLNLENDTITLSDGMSFEDGTLVEPAACVVKGFRRARIRRGDTVFVMGLGVMGMIHLLLAKHFGAGKVICADMVKFRLEKSLEFGADDVIDISVHDTVESLRDITKGEMAELVVVGPNSADAMLQGLKCVRAGGQALFFTPAKPGERLIIDPNYLYFNDINIITSYSCGPTDTADAFELIEKGVVSAKKLVTHRFPVEKTCDAFRLTAAAGSSLKCVVNFD
jgi:L-iditol 2-dehydrogenase